MSTKTRIYHVYNDDSSFLIRAVSKSQAVSLVTRSLFACNVATQDDLIRLTVSGVALLDASEGIDGEVPNEKTKK